eukprot:1504432-Rhodomonas_salina.2
MWTALPGCKPCKGRLMSCRHNLRLCERVSSPAVRRRLTHFSPQRTQRVTRAGGNEPGGVSAV